MYVLLVDEAVVSLSRSLGSLRDCVFYHIPGMVDMTTNFRPYIAASGMVSLSAQRAVEALSVRTRFVRLRGLDKHDVDFRPGGKDHNDMLAIVQELDLAVGGIADIH